MDKKYKNTLEHRQDVSNGNIKEINSYWSCLSDEQRLELLDLSIEEKNYPMLEYFSFKEDFNENNNDGVKWSLKNTAIIKMAQQGEIELVKYYLKKAYWLNQKVRIEDIHIDDLLYNWALNKPILEIIPYLDKDKLNKSTPYSIYIKLLLDNHKISFQNKLTIYDKVIQDVLDFWAEKGMDIVESLIGIINTGVRYYNTEKLFPIIYKNFIDNKDFLKELIRRKKSNLSIDEQRQDILNKSLEIAVHERKNNSVKQLIDYGADISYISNKDLGLVFSDQDLSLIKTIIEAGGSPDPYQEEVLIKQIRNNRFENVEYLVTIFKDKEKSLKYVRENKVISSPFRTNNSKEAIQENIIKYLEKSLLKENLDVILESNEHKAQKKL